jgi:MoxR-like ATPase
VRGVLQEVYSTVPPPQAPLLCGRGREEALALEALRVQRYVELRGGPGEGKSTLACHLAQLLCAEWELSPKPKAGGCKAHAHVVDLRGE